MIKIQKVRMSSNPNAEVSDDGKFNVMTDGRLYFLVDFADPDNPFGGRRTRMVGQQLNSAGDAEWRVTPESIRALVGKTVKGDIVTRNVEPYEVGDNTVTQYTTVVFAHETVETVFRQANHPLTEAEVEVEAVTTTKVVADTTGEIAS